MKNKKIKKFFRSPWFIGVTATAIGSILAESFSKFKILTTLLNLFIKVINSIVRFFSIYISIPLWFFILLLIPAIIFVIIIIGLLIGKKRISPYYISYTRDEVEGVLWKWNWEYKKLIRTYDIENLFPFCPKCDCQLRSTSFGGYKCPNCNYKILSYPKSVIEVEMIIKQRVGKMLSQNQNKR